jgi:hypothetical protein
MRENKIDLKRLLKEEAYCFLAEYFNFRINEYFAKAFLPPDELLKNISRKKVKNDSKPEIEDEVEGENDET